MHIEAQALLDKDESSAEALDSSVWASAQRCTTLLANLAVVMERTEEQMLPAVYRFVGVSFNATPSMLGGLTLARAMCQALASPLGGLAGHLFSRVWVIAIGCILWGVMAAAFCMTRVISALSLSLWAVTGLGLALIIPNVQSTIADFHDDGDMGAAFGTLQMTSLLGGAFGALYATNMGKQRHFGVDGWRAAFLSVAVVSLAIGVLYWLFASDPRSVLSDRLHRRRQAAAVGRATTLHGMLRDIKGVLTVPSFLIIASQGVVGCIPGNALAFLTLYLQLLTMSDLTASCITVSFLVGQAFGGVIGGFVGDWAAQRYPAHGRVTLCQLSVASGIPFCILIFRGLPRDGSAAGVPLLYGTVLLAMGLLTSWPGPVCNVVVFAEVVPEHLRTLIYAFDRSLEGALAACGAPLVGYLAQHAFGFTGSAAARTGHDAKNAAALSDALLVMTIVPWAACVACYCGLHWTYAADRQAAAATQAQLAAVPRQVATAEDQ